MNSYKAKIRVATDMYEFIELDVEKPLDEIYSAYKELKSIAAGKVGLPAKAFNEALDSYLNDGVLKGGTELYAQMSPEQQHCFQQLKKAFNRINSKK